MQVRFQSNPLTVERSKNMEQATSNKVYVSSNLYAQFKQANRAREPVYVELINHYFVLGEDKKMADGRMSVSSATRSSLKISTTMDQPVLNLFDVGAKENSGLIASAKIKVRCPKLREPLEVKEKELIEAFIEKYNKHIFKEGQQLYYNHKVSLSRYFRNSRDW